ncbi:DoxX family protein [Yoonia sp. 2307UL14-13]|uniref:DoxX family protein n=1 Tax=Yoonia sp. 2307UL14-13 TaxID=3126506 RepID=UPI0030A27025
MPFPVLPPALQRAGLTAIPFCIVAGGAGAHEAWLLTPNEIAELSKTPMPPLFTSHVALGFAAFLGCAATGVALHLERVVSVYEDRLAPIFRQIAAPFGPLLLRMGLALMLVLAGLGGLPRHGTAPWTTPTLLVPDMQLPLIPGWAFLAIVQMAIGAALLLGLATRFAAVALIGLSCLGLALFGAKFLSYAPHFIAPALMLLVWGGGAWSVDRALGLRSRLAAPDALAPAIWRIAQVLVGAGFIYLAVAFKLTQPTLLIAILQHGEMPTFGMSYPLIALVMTGVEIICGALLVAGRLIRPVSAVIIGAITFLAVTLGETPLFHANLYAAMLGFVLIGRDWVRSPSGVAGMQRALA